MTRKLSDFIQLLAAVGAVAIVGMKLYTAIKSGRNPVMAAGEAAKELA